MLKFNVHTWSIKEPASSMLQSVPRCNIIRAERLITFLVRLFGVTQFINILHIVLFELYCTIYIFNRTKFIRRNTMATNPPTGDGHRNGAVKGRSQTKTPSGHYVKRNAETGRFMDVKTSAKTPFKGVRKEKR